MKSIIVDFSKIYIGTVAKQGEHNRTQLVFALPDDFAGADYVNAEFKKSDNSDVVMEGLIPKDGFITIPLTQGLTSVCDQIDIQLVAYAVDGVEITEIAKSLTVRGVIRPSLNILFNHDEPGVIERAIAFIREWTDKLIEMWDAKHQHDNKKLLDTITSEMLGGEQADWSENDTTKKSFVKNRTHWHEEEEVTTDYTVNWAGTTPTYQAQPWAADDLGVTLNEGETYTLQAAGATITDVCQKFTMTDQGLTQDYYYIGNLHIFDPSVEDNGFPMLLVMDKMWQSGEVIRTWNIVLTYDTLFGNDLSFSLGKSETVYHPLAMDYMPDGVLDGFSTTEAYPFTFLEYNNHTIPQHTIKDAAPTTLSDDYLIPWINPNIWYRCGSADRPVRSISILELQGVDNSVAEEYNVEFWTGANAPSPVIFPSDVEWPDGSEPVWAANKHYQVSIVGNMGLYAESNYGEEGQA